MTIIGVISDTHISNLSGDLRSHLPRQIYDTFQGVNLILHAGDLVRWQVLAGLESIAPVTAVQGNCDDWETTQRLPRIQHIRIEECIIGLVHGHEGVGADTPARALSHFPKVDCVVFGHSHQPLVEWRVRRSQKVLLLNPGSPTQKRRAPRHSCSLLRVDGSAMQAELVTW